MKINFAMKYKIILIIVIAIILGGGIMLSRPIVKEVTPQSCGGRGCPGCPDSFYGSVCDQDGRFLWSQGGLSGGGQSSVLATSKGHFSLSVLKNRLHFIFKKYVLGVEDNSLLDSIINIKIINKE